MPEEKKSFWEEYKEPFQEWWESQKVPYGTPWYYPFGITPKPPEPFYIGQGPPTPSPQGVYRPVTRPWEAAFGAREKVLVPIAQQGRQAWMDAQIDAIVYWLQQMPYALPEKYRYLDPALLEEELRKDLGKLSAEDLLSMAQDYEKLRQQAVISRTPTTTTFERPNIQEISPGVFGSPFISGGQTQFAPAPAGWAPPTAAEIAGFGAGGIGYQAAWDVARQRALAVKPQVKEIEMRYPIEFKELVEQRAKAGLFEAPITPTKKQTAFVNWLQKQPAYQTLVKRQAEQYWTEQPRLYSTYLQQQPKETFPTWLREDPWARYQTILEAERKREEEEAEALRKSEEEKAEREYREREIMGAERGIRAPKWRVPTQWA